MNRNEFLKGLGVVGLVSVLPGKKLQADEGNRVVKPAGVDCVLIPQETEGPYPLDLSGDATKFRKDVTEGRPGVPLRLVLTVVNINDSCKPVPNARIDIWHTDKEGVYSGYNQPGANTVGETFMRGIQITDANGRVEFTTIYPGWYPGRITHIHFQVFLNSVLSATSQMAFPEDITAQVYNSPLYASKGQNTSVENNASDSVFASPANALQYEMLTVVLDLGSGGYTGMMAIGVDAPVTGLNDIEPETGGQFSLRQNYPNPVDDATTIAFNLKSPSHIKLQLFDVNAKEIATIANTDLNAGDHEYTFRRNSHTNKLPAGTYLYQLTVENTQGRFQQVKGLTIR